MAIYSKSIEREGFCFAVRDRRPLYALRWKEEGTSQMTLTLELSPEREAALKAQAQARGMSVEEWLLQLADQLAPPASIAHLQKTNPQEWMRQFRAWAESHDRTTPLLSDEAVSRESIYSDRD
jgi:hypothetical protein